MKNIKHFITFLVAMLSLSTAALAQDFTAYEGKGLREGEGGAKKVVEGIDFWSEGSPPFKFKIIGVINDRRHKSGLFGKMRMSSLETDVAEVAKTNGGDGVILASAEAESTGTVGMGQAYGTANSATGFGAATAIQKQNTKYYVVKYFKDDGGAQQKASPQPAAEPAATAPDQSNATPAPKLND